MTLLTWESENLIVWELTKTRSRLAIYYCGKSNENQKQMLEQCSLFLSSYFGLEVDIFEAFDSIDIEDSSFTLDDNVYDITVWNKTNSHCKTGGQSKKRRKKLATVVDTVDVFSLFDVLVHAEKSPYAAIIGIFDCFLGELKDEESLTYGEVIYHEVLGRACGNRVACVSLPHCEYNLKTLLCTIIHELLHTVGFDHCNSYRCVVNAISSTDWLFLSPVNLRKLICIHTERSIQDRPLLLRRKKEEDVANQEAMFVIERYTKLMHILEAWNKQESEGLYLKEVSWLQKKIELVSMLYQLESHA